MGARNDKQRKNTSWPKGPSPIIDILFQTNDVRLNGTYAKVRASLATALLRGKSIRRLYESLWFVPCLLAVCLLLKRFFSSLARFAGSSATHTL